MGVGFGTAPHAGFLAGKQSQAQLFSAALQTLWVWGVALVVYEAEAFAQHSLLAQRQMFLQELPCNHCIPATSSTPTAAQKASRARLLHISQHGSGRCISAQQIVSILRCAECWSMDELGPTWQEGLRVSPEQASRWPEQSAQSGHQTAAAGCPSLTGSQPGGRQAAGPSCRVRHWADLLCDTSCLCSGLQCVSNSMLPALLTGFQMAQSSTVSPME